VHVWYPVREPVQHIICMEENKKNRRKIARKWTK